jgi:hypothetical protein
MQRRETQTAETGVKDEKSLHIQVCNCVSPSNNMC